MTVNSVAKNIFSNGVFTKTDELEINCSTDPSLCNKKIHDAQAEAEAHEEEQDDK